MEIVLFHIDSGTYAVRRDDVEDIRSAPPLFRPPLTPAEMAGVVSLDGRTCVLADLAACLSGNPVSRREGLTLLLVDAESELPGFVLDGSPHAVECHEEGIHPLPGMLSTEFCSSWIDLAGRPVPLLELARMQREIHAGRELRHRPMSGVHFPDSPSASKAWRFSLQGVPLALTGCAVDPVEGKGELVPLYSLPDFMSGVLLHQGEVVAQCELSCLLFGPPLQRGDTVVVDTGSVRIAIPCDTGSLPVPLEGQRLAIPRLAARPGLERVVVDGESIFPLVDLAALCRAGTNWHASGSEVLTFEQELPVGDSAMEIMIHGGRYALPRSVVSAEVEALNIFPLPAAQAILLGLALYAGELLTVLDYAPYFGHRSELTSHSRFLLIDQLDFRALLLVDAPPQGRQITPDVRRHLPFQLKESLVCGCYVDGRDVLLVLNPLAMAYGFREEVVRDFRRQLAVPRGDETVPEPTSPDWWRLAPEPPVSTLAVGDPPLSVGELPVPEPLDQGDDASEAVVQVVEVVEESLADDSRSSLSGLENRNAAHSVVSPGAEVPDPDALGFASVLEAVAPDLTGFEEPVFQDQHEQTQFPPGEDVPVDDPYGVLPRAFDVVGLDGPEAPCDTVGIDFDENAGAEHVEHTGMPDINDEIERDTDLSREEQDTSDAESGFESMPRDDDSGMDHVPVASEVDVTEVDVASFGPEEDETMMPSLSGPMPQTEGGADVGADEDLAAWLELSSADAETEEVHDTLPDDADAPVAEPDIIPDEAPDGAGCGDSGRKAPAVMSHKPAEVSLSATEPHVRHETSVSTSRTRGRRVLLLLLLLVPAVGYFFLQGGILTRELPPEQVSAQASSLPPASGLRSVAAEPRIPADAGDVNVGRVETEQITIVIPAELLKKELRSEDLQVVIRWGDTLWDIAARYTGDPWNYRQIARENGIRNPNLIFPRQKLNIRAE